MMWAVIWFLIFLTTVNIFFYLNKLHNFSIFDSYQIVQSFKAIVGESNRRNISCLITQIVSSDGFTDATVKYNWQISSTLTNFWHLMFNCQNNHFFMIFIRFLLPKYNWQLSNIFVFPIRTFLTTTISLTVVKYVKTINCEPAWFQTVVTL